MLFCHGLKGFGGPPKLHSSAEAVEVLILCSHPDMLQLQEFRLATEGLDLQQLDFPVGVVDLSHLELPAEAVGVSKVVQEGSKPW